MYGNKLVTCPYDEVHRVKDSRLQLHITKCRLNHLSEEKFTCLFNATHIFPKQEKDYHYKICPDRAPLDRKLTPMDMNNPIKGRTAVPSYSASETIVPDEVWDDEFTGGHVPPTEPPRGFIVNPTPLSKPAERKRLYKGLFLRGNEPETKDQHGQALQSPPQPIVPRQPIETSRIQQMQNNQNCQNLGIGRGKGAPVSRIAANIFPPQPASINRPTANFSYSAAAAPNCSQLGLGRGSCNNMGAPPPSFLDDEEDFPTLGRGTSRNSTGAKAPGPRW